MDDAAKATAELKRGLEEVKKSLREALNAESDGQDAAKAAADAARKAKAALAQQVPAADTPAKGAPPEVRTLLSDAEQALDDEDPKEALRLADQSFFIQKTSDGWAIKARAHCQLKDLGNAKAAFSNVTGKAIRGRVVADCKEQVVSLR